MKESILPLTDWGKEVKIKLIMLERTNTWLVERVKEESKGYFDNAWLQQLFTGKRKSAPKEKLILEILEREEKSCKI